MFEKQIKDFDDKGYAIFPSLLSSVEIEEARDSLQNFVAKGLLVERK